MAAKKTKVKAAGRSVAAGKEIKLVNPKVGNYVYDIYYRKRRMVMGVSSGLFFIGTGREPVRRHEFIYPLPTATGRR